MRGFVRRHPASSYFALTFAISWGGILLVMGPTNLLASREDFDSLRWVPPLLLGPSVSGLVMTALAGGLGDLKARLLRWRVPVRWYAVALLLAPLYTTVTCFAMSAWSRDYLPAFVTTDDPAGLVVRGMIVALSAGLFEELGWTGFATPVLLRHRGVFGTGVLLGSVWALWHVLPEIQGATAMDFVPYLPLELLTVFVSLIGFRVLVVWVYQRTGSVLIGMLMHASLTAALLMIQPLVTGAALITVAIPLALAPWLVVAAISCRDIARRHPALAYYVLTFAISTGGLLLVIGPTHIVGTPEEFERLFPIALPFLVLGPSISGIAMTALLGGLRDYRARLFRWRVAPRWYAAALLIAPVYFIAAGLAFAPLSRDYLPALFTVDDKLPLVARGMAVALVAGIVEELGWTGFAVPALRRRYGALSTGVIAGALWGAWHVIPKIWGAAANGITPALLPIDLASALVGLTGYRVLMVWVYDRTQSLWIAILMHMALTASTLILQPSLVGTPLVVYGAVLALVPWLGVAVVVRSMTSACRP